MATTRERAAYLLIAEANAAQLAEDRKTDWKRNIRSRETSIAPASVPSAAAVTTLAGANGVGSAKKSLVVRPRAEVDE